MEYQAYVFAGLILVPQNILKTLFVNQLKNINSQIQTAQHNGLKKRDYIEAVIFTISGFLSRQFEVSAEVINKRLKFDELDNLVQ